MLKNKLNIFILQIITYIHIHIYVIYNSMNGMHLNILFITSRNEFKNSLAMNHAL